MKELAYETVLLRGNTGENNPYKSKDFKIQVASGLHFQTVTI